MNEFSRRSLLGGAVAAAASTMWSEPVHAQYVWQKSNWQAAEFDALTHSARRIKLVVHGFADFPPVFVDAGDASLDDTTAGSACGCESLDDFDGRPPVSFFAVGCGSGFAAGVDGIIFEILSFSTSTKPKSVLTLNILSSYATITPYNFLPSFS